ncbi:hypothetical protein, partial [Paraburkholderia sp. Tr-20389]|uniref:hypothetical protein n=1 Tax=Paraburkholderia sp. Tr-20389 TaxID=2703903 RepID=UPI0019822B03
GGSLKKKKKKKKIIHSQPISTYTATPNHNNPSTISTRLFTHHQLDLNTSNVPTLVILLRSPLALTHD